MHDPRIFDSASDLPDIPLLLLRHASRNRRKARKG